MLSMCMCFISDILRNKLHAVRFSAINTWRNFHSETVRRVFLFHVNLILGHNLSFHHKPHFFRVYFTSVWETTNGIHFLHVIKYKKRTWKIWLTLNVFYCTYPFIDFHCNICVDEIINLMSTQPKPDFYLSWEIFLPVVYQGDKKLEIM